MRTNLALMAFIITLVLAGCAPPRPAAIAPTPVPPPRRAEQAPRPEQPRVEDRRIPDRAGIAVTSVYTEPERVRGGDDIELVVRYELDTRRGRDTDVVTTFEVRFDGSLASMPTLTQNVGPGRYESRVRLRVPEDAPRGWYDVEAYVAMESGEDVGGTEFRVR